MNRYNRHSVALGIFVMAATLMLPSLAKATGPVRNGNLILFFMEIRAGDCSITDPAVGMVTSATPLDSLLYNRNDTAGAPVFCNPVLTPDGHQLTLGEFVAVKGSVSMNCTGAGTLSVLHFSGLVPKGTYTAWLFVKDAAGNFTAIGALGTTMPIENFFTASGAGEGQLSVITPEEDLSVFGHVRPCLLETPFEVHLVYHADGQTHGPVPGPNETWLTNGLFLFP
jgi:hypothetical protein